MDPYLATYEAEPINGASDKYGNEVDGSTMLAAVHRADGEATCLSCHEPTLSQQIGEGVAWATGDFASPLSERKLSEMTAATGKSYEQFCLNEACHEQFDREDLAKTTSRLAYNYHDQSSASHGEVAECGDCHKAHTQSVVMCTQCHSNAEVPEGWLSYSEYKKIQSA